MAQTKRIVGTLVCAVLLLINLIALLYSVIRLSEFRHGKAIQLVLQARTDDVIKGITEKNVETVRAKLQEKSWVFNEVKATGVDEITVTVRENKRNADIIGELERLFNSHVSEGRGWTANEKGNNIIFKLDEAVQNIERERATDAAQQIIENRIYDFGVTYPLVERHGGEGAYQILIDMPGVDDPQQVRMKNALNADANLDLRLVAKGASVNPPYPTKEAAEQAAKSQPGGAGAYEALFYRERAMLEEGWLVLEKSPVVTGLDMRDARAIPNRYGGSNYEIDFSLTLGGAQRFGDATGNHIGDWLAIVLNNEVRSVAMIQSRIIDNNGQITGDFTKRQAEDLALVLRSGALPCKVVYLSEGIVPSGRWTRRYAITTGVLALTFLMLVLAVILINRPRRNSAQAYYSASQM